MNPILNKQQFRTRLAKELGFVPDPPTRYQTREQGYHKEVTLPNGDMGFALLHFLNIPGSPYHLALSVGTKISNTTLKWYQYNTLQDIAKFLQQTLDEFLKDGILLPTPNAGIIGDGISNEVKFEKVKHLIQKAESKGYFIKGLESEWKNFREGLPYVQQIKEKVVSSFPEYNHIEDRYEISGRIYFYGNQQKDKKTISTLCFTIFNDSFKLEIGKASVVENDIDVKTFSRYQPWTITPHQIGIDSNRWKWNINELDQVIKTLQEYFIDPSVWQKRFFQK